jgi:thiosulfate/3-mercaptopyruvate sulfurtransferase
MLPNSTSLRRPDYLVDTDQLHRHLDEPELRVFDCAVIAGPNPDPERGKTFPFAFESGRGNFDEGHLPGAGFMDLLGDLCDKSSPTPLMLPSPQQFAEAMGKYGIGADSQVILYSSAEPMWAARIWWMLRAYGFDNALILDGGWAKWVREARPVSQDACVYEPQVFNARLRPGIFADKLNVLGAVGDLDACVINALPPPVHAGTGGPAFGRRGRITGSVNVPNSLLHDPDTGTYLPIDKLREVFDAVGVSEGDRLITYCGGGIASSNDAFALTMLGYEDVAVYDASMFEWGNDPSLPMESD